MRLPRPIVPAFVLSLAVATTASAQVTFKTTAYEIRDAFGDFVHIWISPFQADRRDWLGALGVAAGAAALLPVDDQIDSWIVRHPNSAVVQAFTPWDQDHKELGDLALSQRLIPITAVLVTSGMISDNRKLRDAGWGCLAASQGSSSIRQTTYALVSRERPSLNHGDQYAIKTPGGEWDYHSFFAGHATNAWSCVTFWNSRYHMGLLEPVLYAGAAGITFARMKDRRHWASDTWVGVMAGYAMGRSVAARYAQRQSKREAKEKAGEPIRASFLEGLQIAPTTNGVAVGWSGTFR